MLKKIETRVVHRDKYYFVIIRQYIPFLGFRIWEDKWRETKPRFLSRVGAAALAHPKNIKAYLRGKYQPISAK